MNEWKAYKEVNEVTGRTRWVVSKGGKRWYVRGNPVVYRTRWGAKRQAILLNSHNSWVASNDAG